MNKEDRSKTAAKNWNSRTAKPGLKFSTSKIADPKRKEIHHGDVTRIYLSEIGRAKLLTAAEE